MIIFRRIVYIVFLGAVVDLIPLVRVSATKDVVTENAVAEEAVVTAETTNEKAETVSEYEVSDASVKTI